MDEPGNNDNEIAVEQPVITSRPCRRCRNLVDSEDMICPACGARNLDSTGAAVKAPVHVADQALLTVCACYGVILGMDVLWGIGLSNSAITAPMDLLISIVLIDAAFVTIALIAAWKTRFLPSTCEVRHSSLFAWGVALPILALALAGNWTYHWVLINEFGIPVGDDYWERLGSLTAGILLICVSPAIIEEFFFRGVAWKALRAHMGPHATILVTSAMFGMAHIGVPLSVPVLFGIGIVLGYLRLWSGGLALPMLVHFLHNLAFTLSADS